MRNRCLFLANLLLLLSGLISTWVLVDMLHGVWVVLDIRLYQLDRLLDTVDQTDNLGIAAKVLGL